MVFIVCSAKKTAQYKGKSNGQIKANKDKGTKIMENKGIKIVLAIGDASGKDAKNNAKGTIDAIMAAYCILINELILLFFCFLHTHRNLGKGTNTGSSKASCKA